MTSREDTTNSPVTARGKAPVNVNTQQQIQHMVAFIEQEAIEKVAEMEAKMEEEYSLEKGRLLTDARNKLNDVYVKREKEVKRRERIEFSRSKNATRLEILKKMHEHVEQTLDEARKRLYAFSRNDKKYIETAAKLLLQGMLCLMESQMVVRCRSCDRVFMQQAIDKYCIPRYKKLTGRTVIVTIEQNRSLPDSSCGGAIVRANKKQVVCTLDSRLENSFHAAEPAIRAQLFGRNEHRKHFD